MLTKSRSNPSDRFTCSKAMQALKEFVDTIDATGGVTQDDHGYTVPVADPEWIDLGEAYLKAREALRSSSGIRRQKRRR